ncbi:MAG: hypothetical protein ABIR66_10525 [Saprospiraceae bacterium]
MSDYAQVIAEASHPKRPAHLLFNQINNDMSYTLPGSDPFDRLIDHEFRGVQEINREAIQ